VAYFTISMMDMGPTLNSHESKPPRRRLPHPSDFDTVMNVKSQDRVLVARAQAGEHGAFNDLVRKYRHRVLKMAMRYLRNRADAEDAVQEAFTRAYRGLQHFRGDSAFYSWLYSIAVHSAKTALLLRARDSRVFVPAPRRADEMNENWVPLKEMSSPEELASTEEVCRAVNDAIEALPDEQRTAVVLREFHGLSYRQVASAMSCPIGTVRSRIFRARETIDAQLRQVFDYGLGRARRDVSSRSYSGNRDCAVMRGRG
jgi:RNA polymerase sigma-70 factor, ECF subfamily